MVLMPCKYLMLNYFHKQYLMWFSLAKSTFLNQDGHRSAGVFPQTGHFYGEANYTGGTITT